MKKGKKENRLVKAIRSRKKRMDALTSGAPFRMDEEDDPKDFVKKRLRIRGRLL